MAEYYGVFKQPTLADFKRYQMMQGNADPTPISYEEWLTRPGQGERVGGQLTKAQARELAAQNPGASVLGLHSVGTGIGDSLGNVASGVGELAKNPGVLESALVAAGGLGASSLFGPGAAAAPSAAAGGTGLTAAANTAPTLAGGLAGGGTTIGGGALGSGIAAPAATGTSLTGLAAGGGTTIGGGALGGGLAATGATGALAPGAFAAEGSLAGGAASGGTGVVGGGGGSSIAPVSGSALTLGALAARGLPAAFGAFGASRQADAYGSLANQYMGMGAPYRSRLSDLYTDPEDFLESDEVQIPIQEANKVLARSLSRSGNPYGSGNALTELNNQAARMLFSRLGEEKDRLAGFGGLTQYNAAAPGMAGAKIGAQKGIYDAIGAGAADIFNPPRRISLDDLFRSY